MFKDLREIIIKEKVKLIISLIGAFLSTGSIIIYSFFKSISWLINILSIVCLLFAGFQTYKLYFKDKGWDVLSKIILSILFFILFILILFIAISIFSLIILELTFTYDYFMYAIFLTPSFLFVIFVFMLILMCFSYS